MRRVLQAMGVILVVCLGVRIAAEVIEPVLSLLGVIFMFVFIGYWLLGGPRSRG